MSSPAPDCVPNLPPQASASDFFRGLSLPVKAARLMFRSRKLTALGLVSSAVTLVSLSAIIWLLGTYTDDALGSFWTKPATWYFAALWYVVLALSFVVLLVVLANTLPLLLLAPLQDPLSEATEELCGGFESPPFSVGGFVRGAAVAMRHTLQRIGLLLAGHLVLLPLNLIPAAGNILWTMLGTVWTLWWVAGEYLGAPMARHLYGFREVRQALSARKALCFGFGLAVYLMLWVPILNLFFVPLATVGGTLLFRAMRLAGQIPPRAKSPGT